MWMLHVNDLEMTYNNNTNDTIFNIFNIENGKSELV